MSVCSFVRQHSYLMSSEELEQMGTERPFVLVIKEMVCSLVKEHSYLISSLTSSHHVKKSVSYLVILGSGLIYTNTYT